LELLNLELKKFAADIAHTKLKVSERYTKERRIKKLKSDVEKAKGEEALKQAVLANEKETEERLTRQISNCTLQAPANGRVHYPRPIEVGAMVPERQLLFVVIPEEEPKAEAKPSP
jgi:multidrug resistance efflux pump